MLDLSHASRRLDEMPSFVDACAQRISRTYRAVRPNSESFSLVETVCHLRDVDREGYAIRMARLAEEVLPDLADVDGNVLAADRDYQSQDVELALRQLARERAHALSTLRAFSAQDLDRRAIWGAFGVVTLADVLQRWIAHDEGHRLELTALVAVFGNRP
jgi:hypothetical protein